MNIFTRSASLRRFDIAGIAESLLDAPMQWFFGRSIQASKRLPFLFQARFERPSSDTEAAGQAFITRV
jgi:hypothetical protein